MSLINSVSMLMQPLAVYSQNGVLHTSIHIKPTTHTIEANPLTGSALEVITRSLNGTLPGPTLYLNPGDTLIIDFFNDLLSSDTATEGYSFSAPNESNLHFHGLHVGGGAVATIVVQDDDALKQQLPPQITMAPEFILVLQEMKLDKLQSVASASGDTLLQTMRIDNNGEQLFSSASFNLETDRMYLTNGQMNPTLAIPSGQWVRLRLVHAGWLEGRLDLELPGCQMQLIAKDGVYLPFLPRRIEMAKMINAGRADIMIQCSFTADDTIDAYYQLLSSNQNQPVLTLVEESQETTNGTLVPTSSIPRTSIDFPSYLQDLRGTSASPGCSCATETDELEFPSDTSSTDAYFHETYQGAVVERQIESDEHPYHQHVHPFQIVSGTHQTDPDSSDYYQIGDWHDTITGNPTIRYRPTVFTGKMMIHCHILTHEDKGMMGMEYIHPKSLSETWNATQSEQVCSCGEIPPFLPLYAIILISLGFALILIAMVLFVLRICFGRCMWIPLPAFCDNRFYSAGSAHDSTDSDEDEKTGVKEVEEGGTNKKDEPEIQ